MGKLHTLKRAVLREPEKWIYKRPFDGSVVYRGAWFRQGKWLPSGGSYRNFVKRTLENMSG